MPIEKLNIAKHELKYIAIVRYTHHLPVAYSHALTRTVMVESQTLLTISDEPLPHVWRPVSSRQIEGTATSVRFGEIHQTNDGRHAVAEAGGNRRALATPMFIGPQEQPVKHHVCMPPPTGGQQTQARLAYGDEQCSCVCRNSMVQTPAEMRVCNTWQSAPLQLIVPSRRRDSLQQD